MYTIFFVHSNATIPIIFENSTMLIINKPGGIPIHPCGRYYYNTILSILSFKYNSLFVVHRLDKTTSGLLVIAKDKLSASNLGIHLQNQQVQKIYYA
jgi:23S rRNA-/tRNA-specific pseudouridylate synthase